MRWLHFIFSHSIFISVCAAALCFQTSLLFNISPDINIYLLVFFSTLCSYNFYWLLSKLHFTTVVNFKFVVKNTGNILLVILAACGLIFSVLRLPGIIPYLLPGLFLT